MGYLGNAPAAGIIDGGNIKDGGITNADLAAGVAVANLGYTPVNKAGDTMTGQMFAPGINLYNGTTGIFGASKFLLQQEDTTTTRGYTCGPDSSTYGQLQLYRATSTGSPLLALGYDQSGRVSMPSQPSFSAYSNAGETNYTGMNELLTAFNATKHNIGNCFNTANCRFTAPVAGKYLFTATAWKNVGTADQAAFGFFLNGAQYDESRSPSPSDGRFIKVVLTSIISMGINDYVELRTTAFNQKLMVATDQFTKFSGHLLG